jgi:N-acetylneuraminic acid mutarotase
MNGVFGATEANGILYVLGTNGDSTIVPILEAYDPANGTWTAKAPMPTPRWGYAVASVNGKLYAFGGVAGGAGAPEHFVNTVEAYDPATDSWSTKAPMSTLRIDAGASAIGGIIYVAGGNNSAALEAYDPATDSWTTESSMPTVPVFPAVAAVNGILYVINGLQPPLAGDTATVYTVTIQAYDPANGTWSTKSPLMTDGGEVAAGAIGSTLYLAGGRGLPTTVAYDPAMDHWSTRAPMNQGRSAARTATVSGQLYAVGGVTASGNLYSVEAFTP